MSSRVPSFLLGGINLSSNFFGSRTARTAAYGVVEIGVKMTPVFMVFAAAAVNQSSNKTLGEVIAEPNMAVT